MSSSRMNGVVVFDCDKMGCKKNYEASTNDFRAAWVEASDDGWVNAEIDQTWQHFCPEHSWMTGE